MIIRINVNTTDRDNDVKTVDDRKYVLTTSIRLIAKTAEVHKYVHTIVLDRIVKTVKVEEYVNTTDVDIFAETVSSGNVGLGGVVVCLTNFSHVGVWQEGDLCPL